MQAADSSHRLPAHSVVAPLDLLASPSARVHLLLAPSPFSTASLQVIRSAPRSVASLDLGTAVVPPLVALCTLGVYPVCSATALLRW
jgi:hypothetical protein